MSRSSHAHQLPDVVAVTTSSSRSHWQILHSHKLVGVGHNARSITDGVAKVSPGGISPVGGEGAQFCEAPPISAGSAICGTANERLKTLRAANLMAKPLDIS